MQSLFCFCFIVIIISISTLEVADGIKMADKFTCFDRTRKCYKFVVDNVTQQAANEQCYKMNAQLVSIHSAEENDFLLGLIAEPKSPYWIGMHIHRSVNDNSRMVGVSWTDGSAVDYGNPMKMGPGIKPWASPGQPDNFWKSKPEYCVQMYRGSEFPIGWYDDNCGYAFFGYVCQKQQQREQANYDARCDDADDGNSRTKDDNFDNKDSSESKLGNDDGFEDNENFTCFKSNSQCYKVMEDSINQAGGVEMCMALNATLASVHSKAEYDHILKLINALSNVTNLYWLGMVIQRDTANHKMVGVGWMDGSAVDYGNPMVEEHVCHRNWPWAMGEPNNDWRSRPQNCVAMAIHYTMDKNTGWVDVNCGLLGGFVCQKGLL